MNGLDLLRWLLLLGGLVVLYVIYMAGRRGLRVRRARRQRAEHVAEDLAAAERMSVYDDPLDDDLATAGRGISPGADEGADPLTAEAAPASPQQALERPPQTRTEPTEEVSAGESAPKSPLRTWRRARPAETKTPVEPKLVALFLVAPQDTPYDGEEIWSAAEASGMEYGDMRIFHAYDDTNGRQPVFSMASLVEPGWFDEQRRDSIRTPGLSLFMQLPGPVDGDEALDRMLDVARRLQTRLQGDLRDASRSALTQQTIHHIREEIHEYGRKLRATQAAPH